MSARGWRAETGVKGTQSKDNERERWRVDRHEDEEKGSDDVMGKGAEDDNCVIP